MVCKSRAPHKKGKTGMVLEWNRVNVTTVKWIPIMLRLIGVVVGHDGCFGWFDDILEKVSNHLLSRCWYHHLQRLKLSIKMPKNYLLLMNQKNWETFLPFVFSNFYFTWRLVRFALSAFFFFRSESLWLRSVSVSTNRNKVKIENNKLNDWKQSFRLCVELGG